MKLKLNIFFKENLNSKLKYVQEILTLLGEDRRKIPGLIFLFLLISLLDLAGLGLIGPYVALVTDSNALDGYLMQIVVWAEIPREHDTLLMMLGMILFSIFLLKAVAAICIHWLTIYYSQLVQMHLRSNLIKSYQELPYIDYLERNSSEFIDSIQRMSRQYYFVILTLLRSTSELIVGVVILTMLAYINPLGLVLLLFLLGIMIFGYDWIFSKKLKGYGKQINQANTEMIQGIQESMEGFKEIRILGNQNHFQNKVRESAKKEMYFESRHQLIKNSPRFLLELMMVSFIIILVLRMQIFEQELKTLLPTLGVFGVASLRLMPSANLLSNNLVQLRLYRDAVSCLFQDLKLFKKEQIKAQFVKENLYYIPKLKYGYGESFHKLELKKIGFRYPNTPQDALKDISLVIHAQESIGLIGPSGSGKTTLVDLLLGFHEPQTGEIFFNGVPLSQTLKDWRSQVAYLPQQVFLIDNTLKRNVALGVDDFNIDERRVIEALHQARLEDLVKQLPQGVETLIGERGLRLSGGQRQRVAIARAFYHGRNVLVMDEATSSLDNNTEREIIDEIQYLKGQKTMIVIAHRLTTVKHCDHIFRLENGFAVNTRNFEQE